MALSSFVALLIWYIHTKSGVYPPWRIIKKRFTLSEATWTPRTSGLDDAFSQEPHHSGYRASRCLFGKPLSAVCLILRYTTLCSVNTMVFLNRACWCHIFFEKSLSGSGCLLWGLYVQVCGLCVSESGKKIWGPLSFSVCVLWGWRWLVILCQPRSRGTEGLTEGVPGFSTWRHRLCRIWATPAMPDEAVPRKVV